MTDVTPNSRAPYRPSDTVELGFGDSLVVGADFRMVQVSIEDTLTSCTLTPKTSTDNWTTDDEIPSDLFGDVEFPFTGYTGGNDAGDRHAFLLWCGPKCEVMLVSSETQTGKVWKATLIP